VTGHRCSEQAAAAFGGSAVVVNLDPEQARTGRIFFEDETAEVSTFQLFDLGRTESQHPVGLVYTAPAVYQAGTGRIAFQTHGFTGYRQPAADLGADRQKAEVLSQGIRDVTIMFVAAVVTDMFSQQAGTDTDDDGICHGDTFRENSLSRFSPLRICRNCSST